MRWTLRYAASAARALRKLDPQVQRRLKAARIEILVLAVGHRREVYERIRRILEP